MKTKIINARVITPQQDIAHAAIEVENGIITNISDHANTESSSTAQVIDAGGKIVTAGWIDAHTHGGNGFDYMDASEDEIAQILIWLASTGVTSVLPTIASSPLEQMIANINRLAAVYKKDIPGAKIAGIHLEGPFINTNMRGAQPEKAIRNPSVDEMQSLLDAGEGLIRLVTLAPELPGADGVITMLARNGITVSCGHSSASHEEFVHAVSIGVNRVAHTFNTMPPFHHRKPGLLGGAFLEDSVYCELIMDGFHVVPNVAKLLMKIKGKDKVVLITDATQAAGLPDGDYTRPGNRQITVRNGVARLLSGALAGSTLTMNQAVKNMVNQVNVPLVDVLKMASLNAAKSLQLDIHSGSISIGKAADLLVLDNDLNVVTTMIEGKVVYNVA
jgi:N-acetylglucosamine-6-phosphate deacetylase